MNIKKIIEDTVENERYKSWNFCYSFFQNNIIDKKFDDKTKDHAALMLGFYLASWGMYRGSSRLLLKHSYDIHLEAIDIINDNRDNIKNCYNKLNNYYKHKKVSPTDTLITKIMLGTLGNVPAYDRLFKVGIKLINQAYGIKLSQTFSVENLEKISEFFTNRNTTALQEQNSEAVNIIKNVNDYYNPKFFSTQLTEKYPKAKEIDIYFWNIGLVKEIIDKEKKK